MSKPASNPTGPQRVAVVIPAHNDRDTIAPTVRACRAIPSVDLIVVVDDGSEDDTGHVARGAGAVVVRHSVPRGRGSALETGAKVVSMRDREDWPARHILFMDPDLGDSAVEATALVDAVNDGVADLAVGVSPGMERSLVARGAEKAASRAIKQMTGWTVTQPFATARCLTREAVDAISPFGGGKAVDMASTIDLLSDGFTVVEVPCDFERLERSSRLVSAKHAPKRGDVWLATQGLRLRSRKLPKARQVPETEQGVGVPYPVAAREKRASKSEG